MEKPIVRILLATYNGQEHIRAMVDSVLAQDYSNIQLVLSDDGSTDDSEKILAQYAEAFPAKVVHYKSGKHFGNAADHFMHLLAEFSDAPYIMFCDQDDVWHTDKVSKTLKKMLQTESGKGTPAMVHTDLRVVDGNLQEICPSFWQYSNLDGSRLAMNNLLVQNVVTGCTMMVNRSLAQLASRPTPDAIIMHDWWLALLASVCGETGCLSEATIDYRQHGNNTVGAKDVRSSQYLWHRLTRRSMRNSLKENAKQAEALLQTYEDCLTKEQIITIKAFIKAQSSSIIPRNYLYIRYGLLKYGCVRIIVQLLGL